MGDGRRWLAGSQALGKEDLDAVWPLEWAVGVPGALDEEVLGPARFPRVYAWMGRVREMVGLSQQRLGEQASVSGEEAVTKIKRGAFAQDPADTRVLEHDPLRLDVGDEVRVWPTDTGSAHKDQGRLVRLKEDEVVIEVCGADGTPVRLHTPRWGFRVEKVIMDGDIALSWLLG